MPSIKIDKICLKIPLFIYVVLVKKNYFFLQQLKQLKVDMAMKVMYMKRERERTIWGPQTTAFLSVPLYGTNGDCQINDKICRCIETTLGAWEGHWQITL